MNEQLYNQKVSITIRLGFLYKIRDWFRKLLTNNWRRTKPVEEVYENDVEVLKAIVLEKLNITKVGPYDCKYISNTVSLATEMRLSETTVKRLYGFAEVKFNFSKFTMDTLNKFVKLSDRLIRKHLRPKTVISIPEKRKATRKVTKSIESPTPVPMTIVESKKIPFYELDKPDYRFAKINQTFYYIIKELGTCFKVSSIIDPDPDDILTFSRSELTEAQQYFAYKEGKEDIFTVYDEKQTILGRIGAIGRFQDYSYDLEESGEFKGGTNSAPPSVTLIGALIRLVNFVNYRVRVSNSY